MPVRLTSAPEHPPKISWHRGGNEIAASASLAAFVAAAEHHADFIEVDVRRTRDGHLVCVHDEEVPGLGPVNGLRLQELADSDRARILEARRLVIELGLVDPSGRTGIHLDLKGEGYELEAVDLFSEQNRPLFVTTSSPVSIRAVRHGRPQVDAYLTIGTSRRGLSHWATIKLRWSELFPQRQLRHCGATGVAVHYALATPLLLWWCRHRRLRVVVWTVDRTALLDQWLLRDIDVLTTNRPLFALERRAGGGSHSA